VKISFGNACNILNAIKSEVMSRVNLLRYTVLIIEHRSRFPLTFVPGCLNV
jgi:hypothetical protein